MAAPLGEPSTRANPCCIIPYPQEPIMTQSPGAQFERLLEIMRRLREPGGCPWDREQTRASLKPFLVEETYEVLEAIESGEAEALREELGDLLLQVVFHAQIAAERGEFDMAALLARLVDKMISRHPHVFGETTLGTPGEALAQWEAIKQREAQEALQGAIEKFRRRFTGMEDDLSARGKSVGSVSQAELERSWEAVKAQERGR